MSNPLDGLSAEELDQLEWLAKKVSTWPADADAAWVGSTGYIHFVENDRSSEVGIFRFPHPEGFRKAYSPDFTREQYDAMKSQMQPTDWEAMARKLAEALQIMIDPVPKGLSTAQLMTLFEKRHEHAASAIAKYREMEGKA